MTTWGGKFVLVLALTVMPLQGIAATMSVLLCHGDAQSHALHDQDAQDHGSHQDGHHGSQQDDGGATGSSAYHLCCNVTASASSIATLPVTQSNFPVRAFVPNSSHDLFIPDRPQRPPLA